MEEMNRQLCLYHVVLWEIPLTGQIKHAGRIDDRIKEEGIITFYPCLK